MTTTARARTKSVSINCPPDKAWAYLAEATNWPQWAVVNVKGVAATDDPAWFSLTTPHGTGQIRIRGDRSLGLLDHDFRDPQASWTVPARVVPNGAGCEFLMTFFQPAAIDDDEFDRQALQVDTELATLKQILEAT